MSVALRSVAKLVLFF